MRLSSAENAVQELNASGQKSADGTAIISWNAGLTIDSGNKNYDFYFEYAK